MEFPMMGIIEQRFDPQKIDDITEAVRAEIGRLNIEDAVCVGDTVAITAGSRGVANIDMITKTVVEELKRLGARPFIFPAMGSHGGATAEGQARILANYGITEEKMGCPVRSSMDVVCLGESGDGFPVHIDRLASEADHIVVINRIKPHTKFEGPVESGLMKMMAIGMGKQKGAEFYHKAAVRLTLGRIIQVAGREVLKRCPVLFGLGLVENGYDQTCLIRAMRPDEILEGEKELLQIAKRRMARLPFEQIDILIIDRFGKDISGTGMDINVTGRNRDILGDFCKMPRIKRIFVRDLTDESEGNAVGIGLADFTTTRFVEKMDRRKTYVNCLTGISPEKGAIPIYFDTDKEALEACFTTIGGPGAADARLVHIESTLQLTRLSVSRAFEREIEERPELTLIDRWKSLSFDGDGNLLSPFSP